MTLWSPLLAAQVPIDVIKLVIVALFLLGGPLVKMISEARQRNERSKTPPSPPAPRTPPMPRTPPVRTQPTKPAATPPAGDPRFRNEIEVFLEEVGRRRASTNPAQRAPERPAAPPRPPVARPVTRPQPPRPMPRTVPQTKAEPPKPEPQVAPTRPGAEIAARKAPVSEDLGAQIRQHLGQYLESSRMSQQAQADLGSAVERAVREHLGATVTQGATIPDRGEIAATAISPINALLRNPNGVRTAIMVNEILARPKSLRRKS